MLRGSVCSAAMPARAGHPHPALPKVPCVPVFYLDLSFGERSPASGGWLAYFTHTRGRQVFAIHKNTAKMCLYMAESEGFEPP